MMVLEKGRDQKGWAKEVVCTVNGGCGAKLLVEETDLYALTLSYFDEVNTHIRFECPQCGLTSEINDAPCDLAERLPTHDAWKRRKKKSAHELDDDGTPAKIVAQSWKLGDDPVEGSRCVQKNGWAWEFKGGAWKTVDQFACLSERVQDWCGTDSVSPVRGTPFDEAATVNPDEKGGE